MDQHSYRMFDIGKDAVHLQSNWSFKRRMKTSSKFMYLVIFVLVLGVILTFLNIYELHIMKEDHGIRHASVVLPVVEGILDNSKVRQTADTPIVWVDGKNQASGYLKHVHHVFEKIGFAQGNESSDWTVLWAHDYPFRTFSKQLSSLKPYQRVNHFPGTGFITNKASLATSKMKFIPQAFALPVEKDKFLTYSKDHLDMMWVQKSNTHRGIEIKNTSELDFTKEGSFLQRYVDKPFLIDKHKFDIGVYTILTSIKPLRVYIVEGDSLFRFCPEEYYPFDPKVRDKYVVGDDYLPLWKLPSLGDIYTDKGYTFRETFNHFLKSKGLNYDKVWNDVREAIRTVYLEKEKNLIEASSKYPSTHNFFEMVRFDFVLDEDLNLYLMEANMSPNLSSNHFPPNKRLYEHVIFNVLSLVGLAHMVSRKQLDFEDDMHVSPPDVHVFPDVCTSSQCSESCLSAECKICKQCMSVQSGTILKLSYLEHVRRGSCRRIMPPAINETQARLWDPTSPWPGMETLSEENKFMYHWFIGKCRVDRTWC